jgi:hypothetical protein
MATDTEHSGKHTGGNPWDEGQPFAAPWSYGHPWPGGWVMAQSLRGGQAHVADVRGWGYLTGSGVGGLRLPSEEASEIQDRIGHLMAAAPDLLEALRVAKGYVDDHGQSTAADQNLVAAAIAKAEGRKP